MFSWGSRARERTKWRNVKEEYPRLERETSNIFPSTERLSSFEAFEGCI